MTIDLKLFGVEFLVGLCKMLFDLAKFGCGCFQKWWYPQIINFNRLFNFSIINHAIFGNVHVFKIHRNVLRPTSKPKQVDLSMSRAQERLAKAKDEMHEAVSRWYLYRWWYYPVVQGLR